MSRIELGGKHVCAECGAKFYDLGQAMPACPKCGAVLQTETTVKRGKAAPTKKEVVAAADESELDELDGDISDDNEDEDDDDLGVEEVNLSEENAEAMLGQIPSGDDDEAIGGGNASMENLEDDEEFPSEVGYGETGTHSGDADEEDEDD
ncbi:MAG: FYDLN acid domain-containing protein [Myxococcota bacterium]|nr:FYDLN acid domain-containing protein [Myxococcota bacterium]